MEGSCTTDTGSPPADASALKLSEDGDFRMPRSGTLSALSAASVCGSCTGGSRAMRRGVAMYTGLPDASMTWHARHSGALRLPGDPPGPPIATKAADPVGLLMNTHHTWVCLQPGCCASWFTKLQEALEEAAESNSAPVGWPRRAAAARAPHHCACAWPRWRRPRCRRRRDSGRRCPWG